MGLENNIERGRKFKIYIHTQSSSNVVGIHVLLRCKRCRSDFVPRESSLLSSDYDKSIKECSFYMISETYFQDDYFLDQS